ncbi:MAG: efflux RND transporter periplasmic adaptor subunit [Myxococcota bacterium]|nr:efflux RND transporter periplasmic adaptor subunit [Myxococcota bacterium]MDW8361877.1 efflux RND transporter periplasmic adaptor subunit [Myxococcales bacterium]
MNDAAIGSGAHDDGRLRIPPLRRRSRRRAVVAAIVVLAACATALWWWRRPEPPVELYRSEPVERRTIVRLVEASGRIDVARRHEVPAPIAGLLREVLVAERARVHRGQVLARLDVQSAEFAVRGAQAGVQAAAGHVAEARAVLRAAREELSRVERLAQAGQASQAELGAARMAVERAQAGLQAALASQRVAAENLSAARHGAGLAQIVAPADGVVLAAPRTLGAAVSPERGPLFVVAETLDPMQLVARVAEADIGVVQPGQHATFTVPAYPGRTFEAEVRAVSIEPERTDGVVLYAVTLHAPNAEGLLLPGMTASVRLEVARAVDVLAVREAALRFVPDDAEPAPERSRLFVHEAVSRLRPVAVRAGLSDGAFTQVDPLESDALREGMRVAVGLLDPTGGREAARAGIRLGGTR